MNPIKNELKELLNNLDIVGEKHEEVGDTDVREQMSEVIQNQFIEPQEGYEQPESYGMFSEQGNKQVHIAISKFISTIVPKINSTGLTNAAERLNSFEDEDIESDDGMYYDDYFGSSD